MDLSDQEKKYLLKISRDVLKYFFKTFRMLSISENEIPVNLKQIRSTFVTLHLQGDLRGCIGRLIAKQAIYKDVIDNTYAAAFRDPRFLPLSEKELPNLKIEVSILDKPQNLEYKTVSDLINKLALKKPGVIIEKGQQLATFLPQVWQQIPDPKGFLSHLCQKAGLNTDAWEKGKIKIKTYKVNSFSEVY